ncbi:MAG TPA: DegT/DnrJ/EryC1/StrS family aminotransferase [Acidimicrobiales bacterium]|nr:DegT/DnrJ/EryC1/StrS family aminotransferase [Acidimicrobiales bacterium]
MQVEFFRHDLGPEEFDEVRTVLQSVFLTTADKNLEFETNLASYLGVRDTVTLSSCTAALHLAWIGLGIGTGDEVITTPLSFVASSNSVLLAGATPVFVDVEPLTGLLDIDASMSAVTSRTRAVLPVHLYGAMVDMKHLAVSARSLGLRIVEDAAHAVDSHLAGVRPGQWSDAACFSFYATKAITSGEGGALATQDESLSELVRQLRNHGMTRGAADRYTKRFAHWDMEHLGWKYNMTNFQAAMLLPQLRRIETNRLARIRAADYYAQRFDAAGVAHPHFGNDPSGHSHHLFTVWTDPLRRDDILTALQGKGVGVAVNFRPIHLTTYYRSRFGFRPGMFPEAERIGSSTISLPLYPALTEAELDFVATTVIQVLHSNF